MPSNLKILFITNPQTEKGEAIIINFAYIAAYGKIVSVLPKSLKNGFKKIIHIIPISMLKIKADTKDIVAYSPADFSSFAPKLLDMLLPAP